MVNHALSHFKVPLMKDFLILEIPTHQTTTFVISDAKNFDFFGTITYSMFVKFPLDNIAVREYQTLLSSIVRPMPTDLIQLIHESTKPKRGGKRKAKIAMSEILKNPKKTRKAAKKLKSPSSVLQEE